MEAVKLVTFGRMCGQSVMCFASGHTIALPLHMHHYLVRVQHMAQQAIISQVSGEAPETRASCTFGRQTRHAHLPAWRTHASLLGACTLPCLTHARFFAWRMRSSLLGAPRQQRGRQVDVLGQREVRVVPATCMHTTVSDKPSRQMAASVSTTPKMPACQGDWTGCARGRGAVRCVGGGAVARAPRKVGHGKRARPGCSPGADRVGARAHRRARVERGDEARLGHRHGLRDGIGVAGARELALDIYWGRRPVPA